MTVPKNITTAEELEIIDAIQRGAPTRSCCHRFGRTFVTIKAIAAKHGVKTNTVSGPRPLTEEQIAKAYAEYKRPMKIEHVARHWSTSTKRLSALFRERGMELRARGKIPTEKFVKPEPMRANRGSNKIQVSALDSDPKTFWDTRMAQRYLEARL